MAVVINEFEATAEAPPRHESSEAAATGGSRIESAPLRRALRQQARRMERLRAH